MVRDIGTVSGLAGAGTDTRPGAECRITPTDKLPEFRNGRASSTSVACPASCRQLLVRDPGQGGAKSRELRVEGFLRTSP
jgi:hypothetical protein